MDGTQHWGDFLEEAGVVTDVMEGMVKVSIIRTEACAKCRACIAGITQQEMIIFARNDCGAKVSDRVAIELGEGSLLSAALIVYGIPAVFLLAGFFLVDFMMRGFAMPQNEVLSFVTGICLMVVSYVAISKKEPSFKTKKYAPIATRVL